MDKKGKICLGAIVGVHGIRGEVKVKSFTENDRDLDKYGVVTNKDGTKSFEIKVVGHSKELLRVKIKGVDDRTTAETLKGTEFYVEREALPELKDKEEFYQADLIGLDVIEKGSQTKVGKICGFYNFGAGEILEIKLNKDKSLQMIPFNHQYVPEVNIKDGYIIVETAVLQFVEDEQGEGNC